MSWTTKTQERVLRRALYNACQRIVFGPRPMEHLRARKNSEEWVHHFLNDAEREILGGIS